ncbi:MAG: hypothetical protein R3F14_04715 [Polyangiaceae bacterium]
MIVVVFGERLLEVDEDIAVRGPDDGRAGPVPGGERQRRAVVDVPCPAAATGDQRDTHLGYGGLLRGGPK